jgi:hypothetical protein
MHPPQTPPARQHQSRRTRFHGAGLPVRTINGWLRRADAGEECEPCRVRVSIYYSLLVFLLVWSLGSGAGASVGVISKGYGPMICCAAAISSALLYGAKMTARTMPLRSIKMCVGKFETG